MVYGSSSLIFSGPLNHFPYKPNLFDLGVATDNPFVMEKILLYL